MKKLVLQLLGVLLGFPFIYLAFTKTLWLLNQSFAEMYLGFLIIILILALVGFITKGIFKTLADVFKLY